MSIDKAKQIIADAGSIGDLATCVDGQPRVRPMTFVVMDDLKLWSSTYRQSGKMKEFAANNRVEISFTDSKKVHLRVEGIVDTSGGPEKKKRLLELNPRVRGHFPDENDAKFVHIEIVPTSIRWTEPGFGEYHEVKGASH
ncbi:MAG: pyridoxamine 5'-phosphate oxidase family protein [Candidatus Erginobacter occultus]|nr:pyridoxamine 5'-phosphate oxidase family protein [Candidatus Erginobacter occultus]